MTRVFLDTDVILDFLLDRKPFSSLAAMIFSHGERGMLQLFTSTASFLNVHYIAASQRDNREARKLIRQLRRVLSLLPITELTIDTAISMQSRDFEDAVQYVCAQENHADFLVSRNVRDYPTRGTFVVSPEVFLDSMPNSTPSPDQGAT